MPILINDFRVAVFSLCAGLLCPEVGGAATDGGELSDLEIARRLNRAFIEVSQRVSPAVVVVDVVRPPEGTALQWEGLPELDNLDPEEKQELEEFLKQHRENIEEMRRRREQLRRFMPPDQLYNGRGSGMVIREDGYILTNRHVIENAEQIAVHFKDGRRYEATVRGQDAQSDIAVLKIEAEGLPAVQLADSDQVRVGQFAIAIGAPFNLDYSVTFGHVSAIGRTGIIPFYMDQGQRMDQDFIQTDADINPGNSGGPLIDIEGRVIGINTLIRGMNSGVNFAIASNLAREVADRLISEGRYDRAYLGVRIETLSESTSRDFVRGVTEGVLVSSIPPEGPAARSELKPMDVIVAVEGEPVATAMELKAAIRVKPIGKPVTLSVIREGRPREIEVVLDAWPDQLTRVSQETPTPSAGSRQFRGLGMAVQDPTDERARELGLKPGAGVEVLEVDRDSAAAFRGIRKGDIITAIQRQAVTSGKKFQELAEEADLAEGVIVSLISGGENRFLILREIEN